MAVKIRLSRTGKKHAPFHRLVVVDSRKKRDGAYLANVGTYDAVHNKVVQFHDDIYQAWISKGATPTDSVKRIYKEFKKSGVSAAATTQTAETQA
jgi:small subunit ribosomal protein S16